MSKTLEFPYLAVIPKKVLEDEFLSPSAKIHYGCIISSCDCTGKCSIPATAFSRMYSVTRQAVWYWNDALRKRGFIKITGSQIEVCHD